MWQTETVVAMLQKAGFDTEIITMKTKGDKILDTSIAKIGSKGVFTEELEEKLAEGSIDIAVHSAKDMPSRLPDGFQLIAFTEREKVNDVLLSRDSSLSIEDQEQKIRIGTSSVRRVALLHHHYPHVEVVDMRGNLQTRVKKLDSGVCDALMLAYAGVKRMEYEDLIVKIFPEEDFVPPVGQGSIAIEAAASLPADKRDRIRDCLNHRETETRLLAERAFLKELEGGCSIPAFALARLDQQELTLAVGLISLDGRKEIRHTLSGSWKEPAELGRRAGRYILEHGGRELLAEIREQQQ